MTLRNTNHGTQREEQHSQCRVAQGVSAEEPQARVFNKWQIGRFSPVCSGLFPKLTKVVHLTVQKF